MIFDFIRSFSSYGLALACFERQWGYIDKGGYPVIPLRYDFINEYTEGVAYTRVGMSQQGYIDRAGMEVIPPGDYQLMTGFFSGVAGARNFENDRWGFIDKTGKMAIADVYDEVDHFLYAGLAHVTRDDRHGYIDRSGKEVIPIQYDAVSIIKEYDLVSVQQGGKFGCFDFRNQEVVPLIYSSYIEMLFDLNIYVSKPEEEEPEQAEEEPETTGQV